MKHAAFLKMMHHFMVRTATQHDMEENDVVVEEEAQTTDTARLLRSFFEEWAGIQVVRKKTSYTTRTVVTILL